MSSASHYVIVLAALLGSAFGLAAMIAVPATPAQSSYAGPILA